PVAAGHPVQLLGKLHTPGPVVAGEACPGLAGFSLGGPMIDARSRPRRRERVLTQAAAGTVVLLDLDSGQYYSLDEVSARVWDLCDGEHGVDELLIAGRPAVRTGCMVRGLTLYRFLRRAGADVSLRFGVGTIRGDFAAHCWIVYGGEPLAESHDPRSLFTETWRIEPSLPGR